MVSIRYFCGVGEFCRTKSSPREDLISNERHRHRRHAQSDEQSRSGIKAMRRMAMGNVGTLTG